MIYRANQLTISYVTAVKSFHYCHVCPLQNVQGLILTPNINKIDRLRLVMLFALRYEKQSKDIEELVRLLKTREISDTEAKVYSQHWCVCKHCLNVVCDCFIGICQPIKTHYSFI